MGMQREVMWMKSFAHLKTLSVRLRNQRRSADGRHRSRFAGRLWNLRGWEQTKLGEIFSADLRSLAAFRIAIAVVIIFDLLGRIPNLRVHYTDEGILPRSLLVDSFVRWRWSLNLINDTFEFQLALLLAALFVATCMLLGYRTRLMVVLVWILITSLQVRNPMVLSGADTFLRVILFWAMFLPLGAVWSIDSKRTSLERDLSRKFLSFATIGIFFQIAFMYWFTAALKSGPEWRSEGTALYYALGANHITKPFGEYLHQFPELLRVMTHASLGLEIIAPILLFFPFKNGPLRTISIVSIMGFHLGIYLTMDVGIFPWSSALSMLCFLPTWFWDTLLPRVRTALPIRPDAVMQRWWPRFERPVLNFWTPIRQRLALPNGYPGDHRNLMTVGTASGPEGRDQRARGSDPGTHSPNVLVLRSHVVTNLFLAFCLVFVFLWNLTAVSEFNLPAEVRPFGYSSGLYQKWSMFAPHPSKATVWLVVRGELENGQTLDLLTPIVHDDLTRISNVSWAPPDDDVGEYYGDKYWRKYLTAIGREDKADERRAFAAYTCRTWNAHYGGDAHLTTVQFFMMRQPTLLDYEEAELRRTSVAGYHCT